MTPEERDAKIRAVLEECEFLDGHKWSYAKLHEAIGKLIDEAEEARGESRLWRERYENAHEAAVLNADELRVIRARLDEAGLNRWTITEQEGLRLSSKLAATEKERGALKAQLAEERYQHANCLSIAEGAPGWEQIPPERLSLAGQAVQKLKLQAARDPEAENAILKSKLDVAEKALEEVAEERLNCCDPESGNRLCEHEKARAALRTLRRKP